VLVLIERDREELEIGIGREELFSLSFKEEDKGIQLSHSRSLSLSAVSGRKWRAQVIRPVESSKSEEREGVQDNFPLAAWFCCRHRRRRDLFNDQKLF